MLPTPLTTSTHPLPKGPSTAAPFSPTTSASSPKTVKLSLSSRPGASPKTGSHFLGWCLSIVSSTITIAAIRTPGSRRRIGQLPPKRPQRARRSLSTLIWKKSSISPTRFLLLGTLNASTLHLRRAPTRRPSLFTTYIFTPGAGIR